MNLFRRFREDQARELYSRLTTREMTRLEPAESSRTYTFSGGERVTLEGVTHMSVIPGSRAHRLMTEDGVIHTVPDRWLHIAIVPRDPDRVR